MYYILAKVHYRTFELPAETQGSKSVVALVTADVMAPGSHSAPGAGL